MKRSIPKSINMIDIKTLPDTEIKRLFPFVDSREMQRILPLTITDMNIPPILFQHLFRLLFIFQHRVLHRRAFQRIVIIHKH